MKTVSRLADVWPWFKRAYFLQGFLFSFMAWNVIGNGLVWLLVKHDDMVHDDSALAMLPFAWFTIGVVISPIIGFAWNDTSVRIDRYNLMNANLRARFEDDPNVAAYRTLPYKWIKLWLRPTADFSHYPREIEGWPVELSIYREAQ